MFLKICLKLFFVRLRADFAMELRDIIGLKGASYAGKRRLIMVVYDIKDDIVEIITVHPIGGRQVEARINSGRWIRVS